MTNAVIYYAFYFKTEEKKEFKKEYLKERIFYYEVKFILWDSRA